MSDEVELISSEEARAIRDAAIRDRLGEDWENDHDGWVYVTGHDYMARLTRGRKNLDVYVDLLGNVTVEEKDISPGQDLGRALAWIFLVLSVVIALLIARIAGYF